jgi:hypothetical protein
MTRKKLPILGVSHGEGSIPNRFITLIQAIQ